MTRDPEPASRAPLLRRVFLEHPHAVGEGYLQHQRAALAMGLLLMAAGARCVIHALVPAAFPTSTRRTVATLQRRLRARVPAPPPPTRGDERATAA